MAAKSERISTGGGTFDPDEGRISFLALSDAYMADALDYASHILIAINQLASDPSLERLEALLRTGRHKVFIDSGVYSINAAFQRQHPGEGIDSFSIPPDEMPGFAELRERYVWLVRKYEAQVWGYVELDQGGAEWKPKTRTMLENLGLRPIPVYHPLTDPYSYFDDLAKRYDRICLGVGARSPAWVKKRLLATAYERWRAYPGVWLHVLGMAPNQWLRAMPFNSCDSSTWTQPMRWGFFDEEADGKRFTSLPKDFMYCYDADPTSESGSKKATRLALSHGHMGGRNLRHRVDLMHDAKLPVAPPPPARKRA